MFDSIRSHRRWLMFFLLVLVFPSFVVTGIYGYNRFVEGDNAVAKVGREPISQQDFDAAHREQLEQLRRMFGANFDPRPFDTPAARAATLDRLLAERSLMREVRDEHVLITEDRLRQLIASEPAFQENGQFSYDRYKTLLTAQGLNEVTFEARVREDLARQALLQAVAASSIVPSSVSDRVRLLLEEQRQVRELRFKPEDFKAQAKVGDEQIQAYYDSNRASFETPESVKAEYVVLTLDDVASQITVSEADSRAYYEQNQARFGDSEQRRASHILITTGAGGSAKDEAGARKLAEDLLAKLRANPKDFDKLAREFSKDPGSAANGGDLGFFGRNMMVKPFEDAVFGMKKEGDLSDVVQSEFGFHIIRLTGIKAAQVKPFAEVRAQIENDLRRQQASKKFAEAAEIFTNTVYEQADSLKPVADKLKLQIQTVDTLTRAGVPPRPGAPQIFTPRLVDAVFADDAVRNKRNTEAIEVAPNALAAARVLEHRPAAVRPLAQVRDDIRARVERQEMVRLAREAGEKKLAALKQTPSDAGFAAPRTVSRLRPEGLPAPALAAVMAPAGDKLPQFVGAELDGGTYGVFQVISAKQPEQADPAQAQQRTRALAQQSGAADDAAFITSLKTKYNARVVRSDLKAAAEPAKAATK